MKKVFILVALFTITAAATAQLRVNNSGKVGIGINPSTYKLDLKGGTVRFAVYGQDWDDIILNVNNQWGTPQLYCPTENFTLGTSIYPVSGTFRHIYYYYLHNLSDAKLKTNIRTLSHSLEKIMQVNGKSYNYIDNSKEMKIEPLKEKITQPTFGFIAQELIEVFPELVNEPDAFCEYHTINYIGMIPVLVEAIKEQQGQIEHLQQTVSDQMYEITFLRETIEKCCQESPKNLPPQQPPTTDENPLKNTSASENNSQAIAAAKLFQNIPNPFSMNTEIRFEIPENSNTAKLLIHDMQGAEIKSYTITAKGIGSIIIQGHELPAGMYMYTLLVNNTIIDTKKMILTK